MATIKAVAEDSAPYWQGDAPSVPLAVQFATADDDALPLPDGVLTATTLAPSSAATPEAATVTRVDSDTMAVALPPLTEAGVWQVIIRADGRRVATVRVVVQADDGWLSLEQTREEWADAPTNDALLFRLLESARVACVSYGRAFEGRPPANYVQAQLMQTRAVWQATRADEGDQLGADGFQVRVYPLDANVRALLRPRTGKPVVR